MPLEETLVVVAATLGAAIGGVFSGSWTSSRFAIKSSQRGMHLDDIKKNCLMPLFESLKQLFVSELWFSEDRPNFSPQIAESSILQKSLEVLHVGATRGLLTMQAPSFQKLDNVLYDDPPNHYSDLGKMIQEFDSGLGGKFEAFKREFYIVNSRIFRSLQEKQDSGNVEIEQGRLSVLARAISSQQWANPKRNGRICMNRWETKTR